MWTRRFECPECLRHLTMLQHLQQSHAASHDVLPPGAPTHSHIALSPIAAQPLHDSVNTMHLHWVNSHAIAYHTRTGHPSTHHTQGPTNPMTHLTMPLSSHVASRIFQPLCQPLHLTNLLSQPTQTTTS